MPLGMDGPPFQGFLQTLSPSRQPQTFGSDCLTQPVPRGPTASLPPELCTPRASGPHPHTWHTELQAWLPSQSGNWFHFPTGVWLLRRVTPSMWSGFPLPPLLQPVSRLPFNEHLLCAWHFTLMICYYPHDNPVRQGFSAPDSPVRKRKHTCPWSPGK